MRIILESTDQIVELDGVPCRVWQGASESGIPVTVYVHRVRVDRAHDCSQFERELREQQAPRAASGFRVGKGKAN